MASKLKSRIWKAAVGELLDVCGVVAEDVTGKGGAILLPAGIPLLSLRETHPEIVSTLLRHGITHVKVKNEPQITAGEFRNALGTIRPHIAVFNPLLAQITVHQIAVIFENVENRRQREHGIGTLMSIAAKISPEIRRTPQITLSLLEANAVDDLPHSHSLNVALLAGYIAQKLFPMSDAFVDAVVVGGLFHDIGKAFLPGVLRSVDQLTAREQKILNCHPLLGETLLKDVGVTSPDVLGAVRSHHEKWSGGGTPDGLAGEDIPAAARIVAVANVFENFTSKLLSEDFKRSDEALSQVISLAQSDFDHRVVRALLISIGLYPPGTAVLLSNGAIGVVLETKDRNLVFPRILLWTDSNGGRLPNIEVLNLTREGNIYIKEALDDFSKRTLDKLELPQRPEQKTTVFEKNRSGGTMRQAN